MLARLRRDGRTDLIEKVESGALSVRGALAEIIRALRRARAARRHLAAGANLDLWK